MILTTELPTVIGILRKVAFLKNFAFKCNETLSEETLWLTLY